MFPTTLLTTLLLAFAVAANPVVVREPLVSLPMAKNFNTTGTLNLLQRDQARARQLVLSAERSLTGKPTPDIVGSIPATNAAVDYTVQVGIGSPPTTYTLLVDTGSSNTWIGAGKAYVRTPTSIQTPDTVSVSYGSGSFSGIEFLDTVNLGAGLIINNQSIGVANKTAGFGGIDGILGIGPVDLTVGTLSPHTSSSVPTVTDNLFSKGVISANLVSVSFAPTNSISSVNGELTFGGIDSSKFTGSIRFAPITTTYPASFFWGINQSIRYSTGTAILSTTAGIVDTGTTLILIASDAFARYQAATGAVLDNQVGLLRLTPAQFANLKSLFFVINGVTYELTANAQIWPRSLNTAIGGSNSFVYLIVGNIGTASGKGLDFINGMTFLERYYSVYDTANRRVGLATTSNTFATTN
ncbi:aspartic peptidase A1 [Abortiporus biennis]|nr:aspartic peptidase A1 [Abortiporus biennis]